jgi:hypothetical protein
MIIPRAAHAAFQEDGALTRAASVLGAIPVDQEE